METERTLEDRRHFERSRGIQRREGIEKMYVCPSLKLVFIHIPKTGGSSVKKALSRLDVRSSLVGGLTHAPVSGDFKRNHPDYHLFSIVRNPWERLVSLFRWRSMGIKNSSRPIPVEGSFNSREHFKSWINHGIDRSSQLDFISLDRKIAVDSILRNESLEGDWWRLGLRTRLHMYRYKNTGPYDYRDFYDEEALDLIDPYVRRDAKAFGYEFVRRCLMRPDLEEARAVEQKRYEAIYSGRVRTQPHKKWYGIRNHGREAWPKLDKFAIQSVVDVGTGNGAFPRQALERGIKRVAGVDFACLSEGHGISWFKASAHDLPFKDSEYEWLTAFDTLEHLVPEELDDVLAEFRRVVSVGWFFSISYEPSHIVLGSNLHLIVRQKAWWKDKLSAFGEVAEYTEKYLWMRFR